MIANDFELFHYFDSRFSGDRYHGHDFYEIFILYSGCVSYNVEGKQYNMKPGDILLISDKDIHRPIVYNEQKYERVVLWIDKKYLSGKGSDGCNLAACFEESDQNKNCLIRPYKSQFAVIKNIISNLEKAHNGSDFGDTVLRESYFLELLVLINRFFLCGNFESIKADIDYNNSISDVVSYINENLNTDLSVDYLSEKFFMSKYHLIREFKKNIGYTLHQYVLLKRLILSRELLKEGLSVLEVSIKCGFNDYANFIRCFKKAFGVPPKKYSSLV